jgi:pre-rRNA-processing protein TSR4
MIQLAFVGDNANLPHLICPVNEIPNKVGGIPIWLNPLEPLENVECYRCEKQMPLLLQIYAPEDYPENAFHRVIYIFCCKNGSCRYMKAYRSQLDLKNSVYTMDGDFKDAIELKQDIISYKEKVIGFCSVCGLLALHVCGKCHMKRYCSREHQQLDWNHGHHKQYCGSNAETPELIKKWMSCFRFPELALEEEEEPDKVLEKTSEEIEKSLNVVEEGDDDLEHEEETETEVDKQFLKFQKRISRAPDQVLRYGRTNPDGENEDPLWVSEAGRNPAVEPCPKCKSQRTFEFQVLFVLFR